VDLQWVSRRRLMDAPDLARTGGKRKGTERLDNASAMEEKKVPFGQLLLDPLNPRLPEEVHGGSQVKILEYLQENAVLEELARSYLNNGFFQHEHLIATPDGDSFVALEGNRRLAAVKILLEDDDAKEAELRFDLDEEMTEEVKASLLTLPVFVAPDRAAVRKYLGFRHIGGIKTWSSEAKARYLATEVELVKDEENPFLDVARRVGSNVQGVRHSYIAISVLRYAQAEFGIETSQVQHRRFGVWVRAMNSPDLRDYIGLGDPRSYGEVRAGLEGLDQAKLTEVLEDLIPAEGRSKPVLSDSRDVTIYAQALQNERAHKVLREYGDIELARQVVEEAGLAARLRNLRQAIELAVAEVTRARELDEDVADAAAELATVSAALKAVAESKA
jgi:hypothetical protein